MVNFRQTGKMQLLFAELYARSDESSDDDDDDLSEYLEARKKKCKVFFTFFIHLLACN